MFVPDKGDIVRLNFNPSAGKEIMNTRPALVISRKQFNEHTGFAIVAPITNTIRGSALEVPMEDTMATAGAILVYQLKSLDMEDRNATFIETAPKHITAKVDKIVRLITS